jgi:hypothetical protein
MRRPIRYAMREDGTLDPNKKARLRPVGVTGRDPAGKIMWQ